MSSSNYNFYTIFDYDAANGVLIPKYDIIVNGTRFKKGVGINRQTAFTGLNLFNYIGRSIVGVWNPTTLALTIEGLY